MAKKFLVDLDLSQCELQNAIVQNLATDPASGLAGQFYYNTTSGKLRYYDGSSWVDVGSGSASGTVTSVAVTNDTDGGISVSGSPITSSGTITIGHSNVLSNAQTTSGIYPIKIDKNGHISEYGSAVDLSTYAPIASPTFTGTPTAPTAVAGTNDTQIATTAFVTTALSGVVDAMIFKGTIGTSGSAGSVLPTTGVRIGDTYKIITAGTYEGQAAKIGDMFIATATTPTWAYVPSGDDESVGKYSTDITGDGSATSFIVTHNLNTRDVLVQVYDNSTYEEVVLDVVRTSTSVVTVSFATAPTSSQSYRVVCVG